VRGKRRSKELNVPKTPIGEKIRRMAAAYKGAHADGMMQAADILEAEIKRAGINAAVFFPPKAGGVVAVDVGADPTMRLEQVAGRLEDLCADLAAFVSDSPRGPRGIPEILQDVTNGSSHPSPTPDREEFARTASRVGVDAFHDLTRKADEDLDAGGRGERELLAAIMAASIAGHDEATQRWLCVLTGYKPRTCSTYVSRLRSKGYVEPGRIVATKDGIHWLGDYARPPRGAALVDWWRRRLGTGGERELFDRLVKVYPAALSHSDLLEGSSMKARTVSTYLSRLARRKIIAKSGRAYRAADELGLRAS